jgi:hypothetical protein
MPNPGPQRAVDVVSGGGGIDDTSGHDDEALRGRVEFCRSCHDLGQNRRADFIVWGKLFPAESLGPRCWPHLADQINYVNIDQIDQYAIFDLRAAARSGGTR